MKVEYHPAIEHELREIIGYYNECSFGLGDEFLAEFDRQIQKVVAMPCRWMSAQHGIRRCLMRRFPYVIYFRIVDDDLLWVTVVKHQRRHPESGLDRQ